MHKWFKPDFYSLLIFLAGVGVGITPMVKGFTKYALLVAALLVILLAKYINRKEE